jgi:hypothetical protein
MVNPEFSQEINYTLLHFTATSFEIQGHGLLNNTLFIIFHTIYSALLLFFVVFSYDNTCN